MDHQSSDANPDTLPPGATTEGRPPFNEVSALFPLLTFYTVGYLGLMAAEFFLRGLVRVPGAAHGGVTLRSENG